MPGLVSEDARLALGIDLRAYLWLFNGNLYGGPREIYMQALDSLAKGKCITVPLAIRAINAWLKETKPQ
jgi:hypothetical protein